MDPLNTTSACTNNCNESSAAFPHTPKFQLLIPLQQLHVYTSNFEPLSWDPFQLHGSNDQNWSCTQLSKSTVSLVFPPSIDLAIDCSHFWGSLHGNAAQPRGCICALPVAYDTLLQMVLMAWDLKYIYLPLQIYIWFPFWGYHILVIFYEDKIWAFQKCKCLSGEVALHLKHCGPSEVFMYLCISENATEFLSVSFGP